ncbi:hypothetical protein [Nocardiopsis halophila]|uniref:hypothetical protein n=1 Tax=Nocardiopsis halophila TaxID=141692 RepID=UPI00038166E8|nr:hypothetical protein [Nocardiopsis halophila]
MAGATYHFPSQMRLQGRAEMAANSVFTVLKRRGIPVSEGVRERISACRDEAVLSGLVDRAFDVRSAEELLEDLPKGDAPAR